MFFALNGFLWSFPLADLFTFVIEIFFIYCTYKELSGGQKKFNGKNLGAGLCGCQSAELFLFFYRILLAFL